MKIEINKIWKAFRNLILAGVLFTLCAFLYMVVIFYPSGPDYETTEPLDELTKFNLCHKLEISVDDERCAKGHDTYSNAFNREIHKLIEAGKLETHDEWLSLFGAYETRCQERKNKQYYVCRYDFKGDKFLYISVFYNQDESVDEVFFNYIDD